MSRALLVTVLLIVAVAAVAVLAYAGTFAPKPTATPTAVVPTTPTSPRPTQSTRPPTIPPSPASPSPSPTIPDNSVVASGNVVPIQSADLAVPVDGIVDEVLVRQNQAVAQDQLLVRLDQSRYVAQINVDQADVARADAAVERAQLAVNQLPPDATPDQIAAAQADLRLAQADLTLANSNLAAALVALHQTEVRAPFAGTIADVNVAIGEQATAGATVVTMGDLSSWLIETTDLSELEVVRIAVGDRATITFDALPGQTLGGSVDRIQVRGTNADGGVVFAVEISPDVNNAQLRWNMTATVRITPSG